MALAPGFLISMPQMNDRHFERSVVLMLEHSEAGAMGLVINRPGDLTFRQIAEDQDLKVASHRERTKVLNGGPVEPYRGFVLHRCNAVAEKTEVLAGLYLSQSSESLQHLLLDDDQNFRLILGYAGWGPGQLEQEINAGGWLFSEANTAAVFEPDEEKAWNDAIRSMGVDPGWLVRSEGVN